MLNLDQVTLLCIENRSPDLAMFAINKCIKSAKFKKVVLVTDLSIPYSYPTNIAVVQAPEIKTTQDYSNYLLSDLTSLIEGTHVLVIQWDSFIVSPALWDDGYLRYDYIGAPWPHHPDTPVGNGGFSLRSVKLIKALQDPRIIGKHPEDQAICIDNKLLLEREFDIQFAPLEIAEKFSYERGLLRKSFGFHGFFNFSKVLNENELELATQIIPKSFLGGVDTYELIEALIQEHNFVTAQNLLSKTTPKHQRRLRLDKLHLKISIKLLFIIGFRFFRNFFPINNRRH